MVLQECCVSGEFHVLEHFVLVIFNCSCHNLINGLSMMRKNDPNGVFDYTLSSIASSGPFRNPVGSRGLKIESRGKEEYLQQVTLDSAMQAIEMDAPSEDEAMRLAFFGITTNEIHESPYGGRSVPEQDDTIFSFRASFCGFSCSLVDKVPSEIALVTLKDVDVSANWNKKRTTDATVLVSVGWLQIDNFVPSAPFPVAVCPVKGDRDQLKTMDENREGSGPDDDERPSPLVLLGLTFAPKHKSGILVRSL